MNCPVCSVALTMTDRQGVEIDYCPKCRGVWLDRGELDKIIERSSGAVEQHQPDTRFQERDNYSKERDHYPKHHDDHSYKKHDEHSYGHKKKKKEGFLSDLFDF